MDAHSRDRNMLPSATALGARMSQATFFLVSFGSKSGKLHEKLAQKQIKIFRYHQKRTTFATRKQKATF